MKIKRFIAANMRQALLDVRKEQGPNAVILSNRRVDGGIEVVAAVDYDETLLNPSFGRVQDDRDAAPLPPVTESTTASDDAEERVSVMLDDIIEDDGVTTAPGSTATVSPFCDARPLEISAADEPVIDTMQKELQGMRLLLEDQLASLAWNDEVRRDPMTVCILRHLAAFGLDADIARSVAATAAQQQDTRNYMDRANRSLATALPVLDDSLLETGGVVAVVGPTGVGKTTSIAKLAARFALRHGREEVALVSTDSFRIGAQEQLATFARILDVPVHLVTEEDDLSVLLSTLTNKKLVLIDTAGVSQRAQGLTDHLGAFGEHATKVQIYLALAANAHAGTLDEVIRGFSQVALNGCILTKVDESASLGAAFSAVIRHQLPIAFFANGQRVPEDLHAAAGKKNAMVNYGMRLMRESRHRLSEEFMARNFGEVRTHAFA
ncbi:MAG: flagellar biosynthesis protein FlhF [Gammaproteobacteria bacterium]|nr:flagellar biosynthesis protein FlhF [Gammaproteobacteria bacterium]